MKKKPLPSNHTRESWRAHRRRRFRRHGRRAYIRSAYSLPSLATLGNAICGFGPMYVATLTRDSVGADSWTSFFQRHHFVAAAYLIFVAMLFDALDGRLARFTRHTTDFGGQLDSLADMVSFGCAPAFLALQVFKAHYLGEHWELSTFLSRLIWAAGAMYMSCAAIRLARFNVSNEHGEQHHFSFLGLPSPAAGATVVALVLMQQDLANEAGRWPGYPRMTALLQGLNVAAVWLLPLVVTGTGLLMVSAIRYPHIVNRYLRGRRSLQRLVLMVALLLALVVAHRYTLGILTLAYTIGTLVSSGWLRLRPRPAPAAATTAPSPRADNGSPPAP